MKQETCRDLLKRSGHPLNKKAKKQASSGSVITLNVAQGCRDPQCVSVYYRPHTRPPSVCHLIFEVLAYVKPSSQVPKMLQDLQEELCRRIASLRLDLSVENKQ